MSLIRERLETNTQDLRNLTRDVDNTRQEVNRRLDALDRAGPQLDVAKQELRHYCDNFNQVLLRRFDAVNLTLDNLNQRFEDTRRDFDRRLHRLTHSAYQAQPCCSIM